MTRLCFNEGNTLEAVTRCLLSKYCTPWAALELVNSGITVNAVCPGYTETDMFDAVPPALQTTIKGKIPMGRFAHAEEIAKAVLFLVADGDYITGQQINVNGGAFM